MDDQEAKSIDAEEDLEFTPVSEEEFKEHLRNLLDAMHAISPTRNYVSQMLYLLPKEYGQMTEAYPELFEQLATRQFLIDEFGLQIDAEVDTKNHLTSGKIVSFIDNIFEFLADEERREALEQYLDLDIPNPEREWLDHRVKMAVSEPRYGDDIRTVLRVMVTYGEDTQNNRIQLDRLENETNISRDRLLRIREFLADDLDILRQNDHETFEFHQKVGQYPDVIDQNQA